MSDTQDNTPKKCFAWYFPMLFSALNVLATILAGLVAIPSWLAVKKQAEMSMIAESPYLHISTMMGGQNGEYGIYLYNVGKGVAILENIKINGKDYKDGITYNDWKNILEEKNILADNTMICYSFSLPQQGAGVGNATSFPLISLNPILTSFQNNPNQDMVSLWSKLTMNYHYNDVDESDINTALDLFSSINNEDIDRTDILQFIDKFRKNLSKENQEKFDHSKSDASSMMLAYGDMLQKSRELRKESTELKLKIFFQTAVARCFQDLEKIDKNIDIEISYKNRVDDRVEWAKRMRIFK